MQVSRQWKQWRRFWLQRLVPEWYWPETVPWQGISVPVRHTPLSFGTRRLICRGGYEQYEQALLQPLLKPGGQVLEMGASAGLITALLAKGVGPSGRVLAVEADPVLAAFANTWVPQCGPATIVAGYGFPVWEAPAIRVTGFDTSAGTMGGKVSFEMNRQAGASDANVYDIASLCQQYSLQPDLLVLDIEGAERIWLHCAPNLPAFVRRVLVELHPGLYAGGQADASRLMEVLEREGFRKTGTAGTVYCFQR